MVFESLQSEWDTFDIAFKQEKKNIFFISQLRQIKDNEEVLESIKTDFKAQATQYCITHKSYKECEYFHGIQHKCTMCDLTCPPLRDVIVPRSQRGVHVPFEFENSCGHRVT